MTDNQYPQVWPLMQKYNNEYPGDFAGSVSISEIENAEKKLSLSFSKGYVKYLQLYGGGGPGAFWLYGLKKQKFMGDNDWSVIDRTHFYKDEQKWPGIEDWYIVSDDGSGNPIGIDPEGRVWLSDHDAEFEKIKLADSFEEFLYRLYTDTLYENPD